MPFTGGIKDTNVLFLMFIHGALERELLTITAYSIILISVHSSKSTLRFVQTGEV